MAVRRALIRDSADGRVKELPAADSISLSAAPGTPSSGSITIGKATIAANEFAAIQKPNGPFESLQVRLDQISYARWQSTGTTTQSSFGFPNLTVQGTNTARHVAATNYQTRARRSAAVSSASAGSNCGFYLNSISTPVVWTIGNGSGLGGFFAKFRFMVSDAASVSGARMFVGMDNSGFASTNVDPASLTNVIGIGAISGSTNLHLIYGGSSAQTPVDLGSNFPANTLSSDIYEFMLFASPSSEDVNWQVNRMNSSFSTSGTITNTTPGTTLPSSSTFMNPKMWRSNNSTALAVGIDFLMINIEHFI